MILWIIGFILICELIPVDLMHVKDKLQKERDSRLATSIRELRCLYEYHKT